MNQPHDPQVAQAAQQALDEIARSHEHAVTAVWQQYPAPLPRFRTDATAVGAHHTGHHRASLQ